MIVRAVAAMAAALFASSAAARAQEEAAPFAAAIAAFTAADRAAPPPACATLFVGSSTFRLWDTLAQDMAPRKVINRGFGGSQMEHVSLYFEEIVAPYKPREILLYEGDNDIARGKTAEDVAADVAAFMDMKTEALGATPVLFVSIKPSELRVDQLPEQSRANALIAEMAEEREDLVFVDVASAMLDEDGRPRDLFVADGLHMTAEGYAIWTPIIRAALDGEARAAAPDCE